MIFYSLVLYAYALGGALGAFIDVRMMTRMLFCDSCWERVTDLPSIFYAYTEKEQKTWILGRGKWF